MNYAIIENGTVINVIVGPLPSGMDGIALGDRPVAIGDNYADGVFTRSGETVLTDSERLEEANTIIVSLLKALSEATNV